MKSVGHVEKNWQRSDAQIVEGNGGEEDRECDGGHAKRDLDGVIV